MVELGAAVTTSVLSLSFVCTMASSLESAPLLAGAVSAAIGVDA
jgi:hypothetical protein